MKWAKLHNSYWHNGNRISSISLKFLTPRCFSIDFLLRKKPPCCWIEKRNNTAGKVITSPWTAHKFARISCPRYRVSAVCILQNQEILKGPSFSFLGRMQNTEYSLTPLKLKTDKKSNVQAKPKPQTSCTYMVIGSSTNPSRLMQAGAGKTLK